MFLEVKILCFFIYTRQKVFDFFYPNDIVLDLGIYTISSDL